jgi:hypothetical protein
LFLQNPVESNEFWLVSVYPVAEPAAPVPAPTIAVAAVANAADVAGAANKPTPEPINPPAIAPAPIAVNNPLVLKLSWLHME